MLTIFNNPGGIGDKIIYLSFPENYYFNMGEKLLSPQKNEWYFKHNPYVELGQSNRVLYFPDILTDYKEHIIPPVAHRIAKNTGLKDIVLRHPRLYIHEKLKKERCISIHSTGVTCGGSIPDKVISSIFESFSNFHFIQVGGKKDKKIPFAKDFTGISVLETAEIISKSFLFIGVNSGMMNLAFCYPSTLKKIILLNEDKNYLDKFYPFNKECGDSNWLDFNYNFYNCFEEDIGITYSYTKL
jgi:hypothetical protein